MFTTVNDEFNYIDFVLCVYNKYNITYYTVIILLGNVNANPKVAIVFDV
jgi:hypothetical protein